MEAKKKKRKRKKKINDSYFPSLSFSANRNEKYRLQWRSPVIIIDEEGIFRFKPLMHSLTPVIFHILVFRFQVLILKPKISTIDFHSLVHFPGNFSSCQKSHYFLLLLHCPVVSQFIGYKQSDLALMPVLGDGILAAFLA